MKQVTRAEYWEHHAQQWERCGYSHYAASCRAKITGRGGKRTEYTI